MVTENDSGQKGMTEGDHGLISLGLYGLLTIFLGGLGIHDFAARQWERGVGHLTLTFSSVLLFFLLPIDSFLPPTLLFINWVLSIIELVFYRKHVNTAKSQISQRKTFLKNAVVTDFLIGLVVMAPFYSARRE